MAYVTNTTVLNYIINRQWFLSLVADILTCNTGVTYNNKISCKPFMSVSSRALSLCMLSHYYFSLVHLNGIKP